MSSRPQAARIRSRSFPLRYAQGFRRLRLTEPGKEAEFHDAREAFVHRLQFFECLIERDERIGALWNRDLGCPAVLEEFEGNDTLTGPSTTCCLVLTSVVDKDPAHRARRNGKELTAIDG